MNTGAKHMPVVNLFNTNDLEDPLSEDAIEAVRREQLAELGVTGKAFMILELIARSARPISISEMIRITGLTKPTTHRVVSMLVEMEFLERDAADHGFTEGPRLITLSQRALVTSAPRSLRHSILQEIAVETGETCNYGILSGSEVIYLDRVESKWPLGLRFTAGSRVPAHCTAIGKLMLSFQPERILRAIIEARPLTAYTDATITDPDALVKAIRKLRVDGIGTDNQEFMHGVVCVAVPVVDVTGNCLGCIAVSAPEARMTLNQMLGFVPRMKEAANSFAKTFHTSQDQDTKEE
jgi:DNA-binding IclR family transcriptional regulator